MNKDIIEMVRKVVGDDVGMQWRLAIILESGARESMGSILIEEKELRKEGLPHDEDDYNTARTIRDESLKWLNDFFEERTKNGGDLL